MAMGIFEGHMAKMAEGFKAIRMAELELNGQYDASEHDSFFTYFTWEQFSDEEWLLCPPVVALGGDGAMYDIGFQNLSRMMASGKPIKVIVVDTQVYSNTGGQACTSGFIGQVSDMAQYGKVWKGKPEPRKEIGLIAMAHRNTYVLQGYYGQYQPDDRRLHRRFDDQAARLVQPLHDLPTRTRESVMMQVHTRQNWRWNRELIQFSNTILTMG